LLGTLDISLLSLINNKSNKVPVLKNKIPVGKLVIADIKRDEKANFFNYIYDDYHLKTIFALDLSLKKMYNFTEESSGDEF